ncbi:MAG TPA: hypothetical protein PKD99_08350 [Sphingopyxis sp.]|mgnify:CR=1 FL=1|nr:hypothetical protein [Sphingopyxis sp.]HMP45101.1 hypothetical protein [Sphingopyxis sp.]HMQ19361.1 hypothetical protein [Sphingopyxis sp.]
MAAAQAMKGMEGRGIAIAVVAHILIIGLLSVQWTAGQRRFDNPPMEVDLIAETAPVSTAPVIADTPPAARLGEEDAVDIAAPEPVAAPPEPARPSQPRVNPTPPAPATTSTRTAQTRPPQPVVRPPPPAPTATSTRPAQVRPTGRLDGLGESLGRDQPTTPTSRGAPAAATAAEVKRSIDVAIDGKILPYWRRNVPSGIDIDQLRVVLRIQLNREGRVISVAQVGELTGRTDSNAPQQKLFVERAERSIRQAAPFDLPNEYYDQWKVWDVTFRAKGM